MMSFDSGFGSELLSPPVTEFVNSPHFSTVLAELGPTSGCGEQEKSQENPMPEILVTDTGETSDILGRRDEYSNGFHDEAKAEGKAQKQINNESQEENTNDQSRLGLHNENTTHTKTAAATKPRDESQQPDESPKDYEESGHQLTGHTNLSPRSRAKLQLRRGANAAIYSDTRKPRPQTNNKTKGVQTNSGVYDKHGITTSCDKSHGTLLAECENSADKSSSSHTQPRSSSTSKASGQSLFSKELKDWKGQNHKGSPQTVFQKVGDIFTSTTKKLTKSKQIGLSFSVSPSRERSISPRPPSTGVSRRYVEEDGSEGNDRMPKSLSERKSPVSPSSPNSKRFVLNYVTNPTHSVLTPSSGSPHGSPKALGKTESKLKSKDSFTGSESHGVTPIRKKALSMGAAQRKPCSNSNMDDKKPQRKRSMTTNATLEHRGRGSDTSYYKDHRGDHQEPTSPDIHRIRRLALHDRSISADGEVRTRFLSPAKISKCKSETELRDIGKTQSSLQQLSPDTLRAGTEGAKNQCPRSPILGRPTSGLRRFSRATIDHLNLSPRRSSTPDAVSPQMARKLNIVAHSTSRRRSACWDELSAAASLLINEAADEKRDQEKEWELPEVSMHEVLKSWNATSVKDQHALSRVIGKKREEPKVNLEEVQNCRYLRNSYED